MTFFTIGALSNFRKLWEEGIARLAAVYVLCLSGWSLLLGVSLLLLLIGVSHFLSGA